MYYLGTLMLYFEIADITFSLDYYEYDDIKEDIFIITHLHKHLLEYICKPDISDYTIKFSYDSKEYNGNEKTIASYQFYKVYEFYQTIRFAFWQPRYGVSSRYIYSTIDLPKNWENAKFTDYITKKERFSNVACVGTFVGLCLYVQGVLLRHNSFFVHGVALQYEDKGLIFSAASGVGKTTHTNFWAENFGAEILNGDTPIIKLVDGKPFIYGSPWCGTSDISVNKNVPLDAVVIISRGTENKIRKLSKFEALGYLLPHIRRPAWDAESVNLALDHCETLINTISVYKLECLPNSDAAEVASRGILELNEH